MRAVFVSFLCIAVFSLSSCDLFNPKVKIPAYLNIQNFSFACDSASQGSNSHKITDAWVYVNDQMIGVFETPATVPVQILGNATIKIMPGIKVNGISATRAVFPFYTTYETKQELIPEKNYVLNPQSEYKSTVKFSWIENFDTQGIGMQSTSVSDTSIYLKMPEQDSFDNSRYGEITLDETNPNFEIKSTVALSNLPTNSSSIFLEFNYKCTNPFRVGLIANIPGATTRYEVLQINSTEGKWNKIYVLLTEAVMMNKTANSFDVYFASSISSGKATFAFDNIKVIHE